MQQYSSQIKVLINDEDEYLGDSRKDNESEPKEESADLDASVIKKEYSDDGLITNTNRAKYQHGLFLRSKQRSKTGMVDRVICGSDQSSVVHLESYRSYLMS